MPVSTLPRIIQFLNKTDGGEFGAVECPHCGAKGRYIFYFITEDGKKRGAMAGCIQLFPVSAIAKEHRLIMDRQKEREKKDQKLASWDVNKMEAIQMFYDGKLTEGECLREIENQNYRRTAWIQRSGKGRRW